MNLDWMDSASCASTGADAFFVDEGEGGLAVKAVKVCHRCPVKDECLQYALDERIPFGIWGGLGVRARRNLLKASGREVWD